jgi:hypothetical protein
MLKVYIVWILLVYNGYYFFHNQLKLSSLFYFPKQSSYLLDSYVFVWDLGFFLKLSKVYTYGIIILLCVACLTVLNLIQFIYLKRRV